MLRLFSMNLSWREKVNLGLYAIEFDQMQRWAAHMLPLLVALQQVSRLVVLQVTDAGVSSFAQQQSQDLLLVGATMETGCHVQSRVAVSL